MSNWPRNSSTSSDRKSTRLNSSHITIYTLSLHDALPICSYRLLRIQREVQRLMKDHRLVHQNVELAKKLVHVLRSEEHTSELQSHHDLHSFPTRRSSDLFLPLA